MVRGRRPLAPVLLDEPRRTERFGRGLRCAWEEGMIHRRYIPASFSGRRRVSESRSSRGTRLSQVWTAKALATKAHITFSFGWMR